MSLVVALTVDANGTRLMTMVHAFRCFDVIHQTISTNIAMLMCYCFSVSISVITGQNSAGSLLHDT